MVMARKLILAEKPAVARDLARALGIRAQGEGSFAGERYVITWCIGHLVELCEPAEYDPAWRRWSLTTLPMLPPRFQLRPSRATARQWRVVAALLQKREFAAVINACDAGREGELIFRYCYELAGCRLPIERLWISSLTEQAIAQGFDRLRPGRELDALAAAARCRSEADWLVGMNATRAVTLWRRSQQDVLCSLGRVQTPTLGILAAREKAIVEFVPQDYFEVHAALCTASSQQPQGRFTALWKHEGQRRLGTRALADTIAERDAPLPAVVESVEEKTVREPPPLLFDLGALQQTANRRFGWSAKQTLSIAQALYEQHKLLTYPRTDSRYLSSDLIAQLPKIFAAVTEQPAFAPLLPTLNAAKPPRRIFQNGKVTDHHAIIPTPVAHTPARLAALSGEESKLLDLVTRRFLAAFFPDAEFLQTRVVVCVGEASASPPRTARRRAVTPPERAAQQPMPGVETANAEAGAPATKAAPKAAPELLMELPPLPDRYYAQGRVRLHPGWQEVAGIAEDKANRGRPKPQSAEAPEEEDEADASQALPRLHPGQPLAATYEVQAKQTQPPPRYTEATLLSAMEGAGRQLDDEALQEAMKDRGLGTPATRAAVIETLLDRSYILRHGKQLQPTPLGMDLIARLPVPSLGSAQLTGEWEARLSRMARDQESRAAFMADIATYVQQIIAAVKSAPPPAAVALSAPARRAPAGEPSRPATRRRAPVRRGRAGSAAKTDARPFTERTVRRGKASPPPPADTDCLIETPARRRRSASAAHSEAPSLTAQPVRRSRAAPASRADALSLPKRLVRAPKKRTSSPPGEDSPVREKRSRAKTTTRSATRARGAESTTAAVKKQPATRRRTPVEATAGHQAAAPLALPVAAFSASARPLPPSREPAPPPAVLAPPRAAAPPPLEAAPRLQDPAPVAVGRPVEPRLDCPRCRTGFLIWGRRAWGCANFRSCPLIIPYEFRGRRLGERDLRNLIERGESLPMLLAAADGSRQEVRARLRLSLSGRDGFLSLLPLAPG